MLSRLQDELDDGYFLKDDACIADVDYPSIARYRDSYFRPMPAHMQFVPR